MVMLMHIVLCHLFGWHCQLHSIYTAFLHLVCVCVCVALGLHVNSHVFVCVCVFVSAHLVWKWTVKCSTFCYVGTVAFSTSRDTIHTCIRLTANAKYWLYMHSFKCRKWISDVKCQRNRNLLSALSSSAFCNDAMLNNFKYYIYIYIYVRIGNCITYKNNIQLAFSWGRQFHYIQWDKFDLKDSLNKILITSRSHRNFMLAMMWMWCLIIFPFWLASSSTKRVSVWECVNSEHLHVLFIRHFSSFSIISHSSEEKNQPKCEYYTAHSMMEK